MRQTHKDMREPATDLLRQLENDVLRALVTSLETAHPSLRGHSERVASYAVATACELGMDDLALRRMRIAAALHDIGMLGLPNWLIQCPELTPENRQMLRQHPQLGVQIIQRIERFQPFAHWIASHHERWDGNGYPGKLSGEVIPEGARVIAVAEAFDVMTSPSIYREPLLEEQALQELQNCAGSQFDPRVVEAFLRVQSALQPVPFTYEE
jgi:putative nucleotidyltransferase with HDIG domain